MEIEQKSWFGYLLSVAPRLMEPIVDPSIVEIMKTYSRKQLKNRDKMYNEYKNDPKMDREYKNVLFRVMDVYEAIVEITGKRYNYEECFTNVGEKILTKYCDTKDSDEHRQLYKFVKDARDDFYHGFIQDLVKVMDMFDRVVKYRDIPKELRGEYRKELESKLCFEEYHRFHICTVLLHRCENKDDSTVRFHSAVSSHSTMRYPSHLFNYNACDAARCAAAGVEYVPPKIVVPKYVPPRNAPPNYDLRRQQPTQERYSSGNVGTGNMGNSNGNYREPKTKDCSNKTPQQLQHLRQRPSKQPKSNEMVRAGESVVSRGVGPLVPMGRTGVENRTELNRFMVDDYLGGRKPSRRDNIMFWDNEDIFSDDDVFSDDSNDSVILSDSDGVHTFSRVMIESSSSDDNHIDSHTSKLDVINIDLSPGSSVDSDVFMVDSDAEDITNVGQPLANSPRSIDDVWDIL